MAKPPTPAKPPGTPGGPPTAPLAHDDTIPLITLDTSVISFLINPADLLANDTVRTGYTPTITAAQGVTGGLVQILPNGQLDVHPTDPFHPSVTFNYSMSDGHGGTSSAVATVNYQVANSPPIAGDDTFSSSGNNVFLTSDFLANDRDPNGDPLTVLGIGQVFGPANTKVQMDVLTNVPGNPMPAIIVSIPGGVGTVVFDYIVSDNHNAVDIGKATITFT